LLFAFVFLAHNYANCQNYCSYPALKDVKKYKIWVDTQKNQLLVNLVDFVKKPIFKIYYTTTNNFTKTKLYTGEYFCMMALPAATALGKVQDSLQKMGLSLIIYDAYRPYAATCKMWEIVPDERYAANPANGSGHNRGIAVDCGLWNLEKNELVPMPTGFDNFSDTSHHDFNQLPENIIKNRSVLKNVMAHFGFKALQTEWWHYYYTQISKPEVMNISFKQANQVYSSIYKTKKPLVKKPTVKKK
jgi:zinc D-Ala-D-Ala dipeptidase